MKLENKNRRQLKSQYWKLLSELIRLEKPLCEICEKQKTTEVHHIIKKSQGNSVYFYRNNLLALCRSCHFNWHYKWSEKERHDIVCVLGGESNLWEELHQQRNKIVKLPRYQLIESIKGIRDKLKKVGK